MNDNQNIGIFFVKLEAIFQKKEATRRDPFFASDLNAIKIEKRHLKVSSENFFKGFFLQKMWRIRAE